MVEGGATNFSNFIIRPSGGGMRVSRQHRVVPHPVTLVSYFFNRSHRNNDFSFSGGIEIQAEFYRLLFNFWPERRGQIFLAGSRSKSRNSGRILPTTFQLSAGMKGPNFFGRWSVKISKFRPNFSDYISTFSLKEVPKFFLDKMHSHFRPERTKVVRRRRVSLVLFLIFFVTFLKRREVSCVWFQSSRFLKNDLFRIISRWCDEKSRYLYFLSFFL